MKRESTVAVPIGFCTPTGAREAARRTVARPLSKARTTGERTDGSVERCWVAWIGAIQNPTKSLDKRRALLPCVGVKVNSVDSSLCGSISR